MPGRAQSGQRGQREAPTGEAREGAGTQATSKRQQRRARDVGAPQRVRRLPVVVTAMSAYRAVLLEWGRVAEARHKYTHAHRNTSKKEKKAQ